MTHKIRLKIAKIGCIFFIAGSFILSSSKNNPIIITLVPKFLVIIKSTIFALEVKIENLYINSGAHAKYKQYAALHAVFIIKIKPYFWSLFALFFASSFFKIYAYSAKALPSSNIEIIGLITLSNLIPVNMFSDFMQQLIIEITNIELIFPVDL